MGEYGFNSQYNLSLTHKHVRVLITALDTYIRTELGQFERLVEDHLEISVEKRKQCKFLFDQVKEIMYGMRANESMGICNTKLHGNVRICYEIEKTLQKIIAEIENHQRYSVWHDGPMKISNEPLPKIEISPKSREWRLKGIHPGDVVRVKEYTKRMYKRKSYGIKYNSTGVVEEVVGNEMIVHFAYLDASLKMYQREVEVVDDTI